MIGPYKRKSPEKYGGLLRPTGCGELDKMKELLQIVEDVAV
jgi:hypothetical protein